MNDYIDLEKEIAGGLTPKQQRAADERKLERMKPRLPLKDLEEIANLMQSISDRYEGKEVKPDTWSEFAKEVNDRLQQKGFRCGIRLFWRTASMSEPLILRDDTEFPPNQEIEILPEISIDLEDTNEKLFKAEAAIAESEKRRQQGNSYWGTDTDVAKADVFQKPKKKK